MLSPWSSAPPYSAPASPVVLGVDRLRNQLGLDPFEVFGASGFWMMSAMTPSIALLDLRELDARASARP